MIWKHSMTLNKKLYSIFCPTLLTLAIVVVAACAQAPTTPSSTPAEVQAPAKATPTIVISTTRIPVKSFFDMKGSGFTAKSDLYSHLKKPNGSEYPVIQMLSDNKGEFTHEIDTLLLMIGTHELWVVDAKTGVSSNVAKFEVIRN
jgi:hypothetical protein